MRYHMNNTIQSSVKDPVIVINQFIKTLDVFIKESIVNINKMKSKHQQMANFRKGDQYNKFTAVLSQSIKDAAKELTELQKLRDQLVKKAQILSKAVNN